MKTIFFFIVLSLSVTASAQTASEENSVDLERTRQSTYKIVCVPNPTSDLLLLKTEKEIATVLCFDSSGKEQRITKLPNNMLSLEEVPTGWLFLHIVLSDGTITKQSVYKL